MLHRSSIGAGFAAMALLLAGAFNNNARAAWAPGDVITYDQVQWGGSDPTAVGLLNNNFFSVYPSGILEVGIPGTAGFSMRFSAPSFVQNYLPAIGPFGPLTGDLADPSTSPSGSFGGEVLGLRLNIDFSDAGLTLGTLGIPFGDLELYDLSLPQLNGLTVRQFDGEVNTLLGGGPGIYSIAEVIPILVLLNSSFTGGVPTTFAQEHLRVVPEPGSAGLALLALLMLAPRRRNPERGQPATSRINSSPRRGSACYVAQAP